MTKAITLDMATGMGFEQEFRRLFEGAIGQFFKNQTEMSSLTGINQGSLSGILSGKKKSIQLETVGRFLDSIGATITFPSQEKSREVCWVDAKTVSSGAALPPPDAEEYLAVPLASEAGAGPGMLPKEEFASWVLVHRGMPSIARRSNLIAVEISKNSRSMVPLLHPGDIVLVDLDDWGQDSRYDPPGNIFLVREPGQEGGGKIKRVTLNGKGENATIIYYSENVQENVPEPYSIAQDFDGELRRAIVGKVVWAWTDLSRK